MNRSLLDYAEKQAAYWNALVEELIMAECREKTEVLAENERRKLITDDGYRNQIKEMLAIVESRTPDQR